MITLEQATAIRVRANAPETTNDERSALEVFDFVTDKPRDYFAYLASDNKTITTWTGEKLGDVIHLGFAWRDNFGGTRQSISVRAINGCTYHGWHYPSAGTYARLRKAK